MTYDYDITVIGGGPGGYVAAIRAAQEGKKTCLVERGRLGGVCLNEGCIPTKTLIRTANVLHEVTHAADFAVEGVDPALVRVSMPALQKRKTRVVNRLVGGVKALLKSNKVTVIEAAASFVDAHTVTAGDQTISSESFIIATGSQALVPAFIKQEGVNTLLTSREALNLESLPDSVAIIGGGVIGIEFAYLFNRLGCTVTVLELLDHILPMVDEDVSDMARKRLTKDGVTILTGAKVQLVRDNTVIYAVNEEQAEVQADAVLMAVGRVPDLAGLNVEAPGLTVERGAIVTDNHLRTSVPHIYAIGDVNAKVMLAHTASHEGLVAVENLCGREAVMHYHTIPSCIYLDPEIASIGLTEKQAREQRPTVKVGTFPMAANGKALVEGDTDGVMKVIVDGDSGKILGAHLYGKHVTDMIGELSLAMSLDAKAGDVIEAIHPHPTINEALPEAFMAVYGKAINTL